MSYTYTVCKKFEFPYGHRLYKHKGACCNLHGHNALLEVYLCSDFLTDEGMVIDFSDMSKKIKNELIEPLLDHAFIYYREDEIAKEIVKLSCSKFLEVDFNPTAENLCKFIYDKIDEMFVSYNNVNVLKVVFYETSTSFAEYTKK